jgi:hypothetical protein
MMSLIMMICVIILGMISIDMYRNHILITKNVESFEGENVAVKEVDKLDSVVSQLREAVNTMESRNSEQLASIRESIAQLEVANTPATGMAAEQQAAVSLVKPDTTIAGSNTEIVKANDYSPPVEVTEEKKESFMDFADVMYVDERGDDAGDYNMYSYNNLDNILPDNTVDKRRVERFINRSYTVMPTQFYELTGETMSK